MFAFRSKYPLAIVEKMLEVFGKDLALGYDIGCWLETTIKNSPLGPMAIAMDYCCLVGVFHGHVHNCLCQSWYLATYVKGLGLKDLEGCEHFFSKSNALASSTWYASRFHHCQATSEYATYTDKFETYQKLHMSHLASFINTNTHFTAKFFFKQLLPSPGLASNQTSSSCSTGKAQCDKDHSCWGMAMWGGRLPSGTVEGATPGDMGDGVLHRSCKIAL